MTIPMLSDDDLPPLPGSDLSKEDVQHRVDDWIGRLETLFQGAEAWADAHGWTASHLRTIAMNEDPVQRHDVTPAEQPVLRVEGPQGAYALFKPKGLWVIGANGRVDLYTSKGVYVLIDQAEEFREPLWRLFRVSEKPEGIPYTPELLAELA